VVVLDLIDAPAPALTRVPRSTWLRLQRIVEGTEIALLLLAAVPVARSAGGLSIATGAVAEPGSGVAKAGGSGIAPGVALAGGTAPYPTGRLSAERTARAHTVVRWKGAHDRVRRLGGFTTGVRATSPRGYVGELPLAIG
jgi:hypothetical protein